MSSLLVGVVGLGVGWLVGLSQSPVIAATLAALVAAAGAIVGSLGKLTDAKATASLAELINPLPLAALVIGIAIGAPAGLYARSNAWFAAPVGSAPSDDAIIKRWTQLGIAREEVIKRLFERELPSKPAATDAGQGSTGRVPAGLVSGEGYSSECARFRIAPKDQLLLEMRASSRESLRALANALAASKSADLAPHLLEIACPQSR